MEPLENLASLESVTRRFDLILLDVPLTNELAFYRELISIRPHININEENNDLCGFLANIRGSFNLSGISDSTREHYGPRLMCSPEWAVIDDSLCGLSPVEAPADSPIPVAFGGADPLHLGSRFLPRLSERFEQLFFHHYRGPADTMHIDSRPNISELRGRTSIALHERGARLAIVSGGLTMYEFLRAGIPCIVLCQTEFEAGSAREMQERGALLSLGMGDRVTADELCRNVERLLSNNELMRRFSQRGSSLVDGLGARRIADLIRG